MVDIQSSITAVKLAKNPRHRTVMDVPCHETGTETREWTALLNHYVVFFGSLQGWNQMISHYLVLQNFLFHPAHNGQEGRVIA